jgi:HupE / UreJ protein
VSFAIGMSFICHRLRLNGNAKYPEGVLSFEEGWHAALALLVELFRSTFVVRTPVSPQKSRSVRELPRRFGGQHIWPTLSLLAGNTGAAAHGNAAVTAGSFLLLGGLLAVDARLSLRVTTTIAAALSLYHGDLNGTGMGQSADTTFAVMGLLLLSLSGSHLRRDWWCRSDR